MELPGYQPFYLHSADALRAEIARLGLDIPLAGDPRVLAQTRVIGEVETLNRFCSQPVSGGDARADGAPEALTTLRYERLAAGGFGLIWMERTAAHPETHVPGGLCLSTFTVADFARLVRRMRAAASQPVVLILQLNAPNVSSLVAGARLACEAGFDGVDIQGTLELRVGALEAIGAAAPTLLRGVCAVDYRKTAVEEVFGYVERLNKAGLQVLNLTAASPCLSGSDRGRRAFSDHENPQEHPLTTLARQMEIARAVRGMFPALPLIGSGFGWLRHFVVEVAAGVLEAGWMDWVGLGRGALACPDLPTRVLSGAGLAPESVCMACFACSALAEEGRRVGCVVRDGGAYGPEYQEMRRFDAGRLLAGARRCHLCEAAPCVAASPTGTDIPGFLKAFREGREDRAYALIRAGNPLPELCALTAPAWLEEEGVCVERQLTGTSVPILDVQYALAWRARERGLSGVRIPEAGSGRCIAVVGGGPAGIAAASRLVELGHLVCLHEATDRLGGVPVRALARTRAVTQAEREIGALLQPALAAGRLEIRTGSRLGQNFTLEHLEKNHDAILVATGLWREPSLGRCAGVTGALDLLEGGLDQAPARVALLAGGDAAMDAARLLQAAGAEHIYVIYAGTRAELHWHMSEGWFASKGVHALMEWRPEGYLKNEQGRLVAVRIRHMEFGMETELPVDFVVEAMGLEPERMVLDEVARASEKVQVIGALGNGGASVGRCVAEGVAAAERIHASFYSDSTP